MSKHMDSEDGSVPDAGSNTLRDELLSALSQEFSGLLADSNIIEATEREPLVALLSRENISASDVLATLQVSKANIDNNCDEQ